MIRKGILKSFETGTHRATVQIIGSLSTWLTIPTTHGIAAVDMVDGSSVAVLTPDESKPGDSVVIAVWTQASGPYEFGITLNFWLGNQVLTTTLTEAEAVLTETPSSDPETLTTITFKSSVLDTPTPFTITEGNLIEIHFAGDESSGAGRNEGLTCVLGYVDEDGSSNFVQIGQESLSTDPLTTTKTIYALHIHVDTTITIPEGKRLWLKFIATTISGAGGYPELNVYYNAPTHHILIPVAGSVLAAYIPKALLSVRGDILYRNATEPARLAKGTEGTYLKMGANDPEWFAGKTFVAITPKPIVRHWASPVSTGPATATVSSVSGDVITLTANEAYRFWAVPLEQDSPNGNVALKLHNLTRGEYAWIIASAAVNTLQVSDTADIAAWQLNDAIDTSIPGLGNVADKFLDISLSIPMEASHVYLKLQSSDSGVVTFSKGIGVSIDGTGGTLSWVYSQLTDIWNVTNVVQEVGPDRTITFRFFTVGVDSGSMLITILGYYA